jgi:toxin ParE1/3/4
MKYTVEISQAAGDDLAGITMQIAEVNPTAAIRVFYLLKERCGSLDQFPERGKSVASAGQGVRHVFAGKFIIRYRVNGNLVQILRIVDGRRNLPEIWNETT